MFHAHVCIRACDILCWALRICELGVSFTSFISKYCWGCCRRSRAVAYLGFNIFFFGQIVLMVFFVTLLLVVFRERKGKILFVLPLLMTHVRNQRSG